MDDARARDEKLKEEEKIAGFFASDESVDDICSKTSLLRTLLQDCGWWST